MSDALLDMAAVKKKVSLSHTTIYELMKLTSEAERFPPPIKLGRVSRWSEAEVDAWIERMKDTRHATAANEPDDGAPAKPKAA